MAYFCRLAGLETAKVMAPAVGRAEGILAALRVISTALYGMMVELSGSDPDDDAESFTALQRVYTPDGRVPIPFDPVAFRDPALHDLPADAPESHKHLAQYIGHVMGNIARSIYRGFTRGPGAEPGDDRPRGGSRGADPTPARFSETLAQFRDLVPESRRGAFDTLVDSMRQIEEREEQRPSTPDEAGVDAQGAVLYEPYWQLIEEIWQTFSAALRTFCPDSRADAIVAETVEQVLRKLPVAAAIEALGRAREWQGGARNFASNRRIGRYVHWVLQSAHERVNPDSDIVTERWNSDARPAVVGRRGGRGREEISVRGPSTRGGYSGLRNLVGSRFDDDRFFSCVAVGFSFYTSPFSAFERTLRADLIDRGLGMIWEIKPILSAVAGVLQEAKYRVLFNLAREVFRCAGRRVPYQLMSGDDSFALPAPFSISRQAGEPAIAVPFILMPQLRGLILYIVLRAAADAATLAALFRALERIVRRESREARQRARQSGGGGPSAPAPAYEVDWEALQFTLMVIVILVLLLLAAVVIVAAVTAARAVPQLLAVAAAQLLAAAARMLFVYTLTPSSDGILVRFVAQEPPEDGELADLHLPGIRLSGLTPDVAVATLDFLGAARPIAMDRMTKRLAYELEEEQRRSSQTESA